MGWSTTALTNKRVSCFVMSSIADVSGTVDSTTTSGLARAGTGSGRGWERRLRCKGKGGMMSGGRCNGY